VRCRSTIANANAPRASVMHPSRNPRIANIEKRAGKRNRSHHVRTSSVGRAGRSGVFASTSSSFVVVIGCSSASAAAVRPRRVVRRRPDIVFARVALTRRETSRRASRGGLFHMSERFPCVRIVYFYRCVRATIGVGFFIPFHPCLCFSLVIIIPIPIPSATSDASTWASTWACRTCGNVAGGRRQANLIDRSIVDLFRCVRRRHRRRRVADVPSTTGESRRAAVAAAAAAATTTTTTTTKHRRGEARHIPVRDSPPEMRWSDSPREV
jgi:hypothetical protein